MSLQSDAQLLREYAGQASEPAFTELVARYTNLVYGAALRQAGSPDAAAEVTQSVFIGLARGARKLSRQMAENATLAGWLCRSTRNVSLNLRRDEFRRHSRERQAMENVNENSESPPDWERLRPVLDDAMSELSEPDYDALVMRFFNNQDFHAIGRALGASDDTAQKRVSRALEKLREHLSSRGITTTVAALSVILPAKAVPLAPPGLAAALSTVALAQAPLTATTATGAIIKAILMTTMQKGIVIAAISAAIGMAIYEAREAAHWRAQALDFQRQQADLAGQVGQLQQDRDDVAHRLAALASDNSKLRTNVLQQARQRDDTNLTGGDPALLALFKKAALLKQKLEQMPGMKIPELKFLTAKDWADAVAGYDLTTDDGLRSALSNLRGNAINTFLNQMTQDAMKKYLAANNDVLPPDLYSLEPYFNQPVTDDMLQRYKLLQTGVPDEKTDLVELVAPYADEDYDSTHGMSLNGAHGGSFNHVKEAVDAAAAAFAMDNNGQLPGDPSQITPYLTRNIEPAAIQNYLAQMAADPPPPELGVVMPALTAYRQANNGQSPDNPLQVVPYLTTPDEQAAFLKLAQLPPETFALAPALQTYFAAHNGQPPQNGSDLAPYLTTTDEQAAFQKVMQSKNPPFK